MIPVLFGWIPKHFILGLVHLLALLFISIIEDMEGINHLSVQTEKFDFRLYWIDLISKPMRVFHKM